MSIRKAEKAGSWYPAEPPVLREWLDAFLAEAPAPDTGTTPHGAMVPHAGLSYSGPTAAYAYKALASQEVETIIILGAIHTMHIPAPAIWVKGSWQTPLGDIAVDETLAKEILSHTSAIADDRPHWGDNAIELQMPFIRHCFPKARIVPIAVPPTEAGERFGAELVACINTNTAVIASSDMTHYGASFGVMPAGTGQKAVEWVHANDRRLIDRILALDAEAILPEAHAHHNACGAGAIAAMVTLAKHMGWSANLLHYTTSNDIQPEEPASHMVGYASILFSQ